MINRVFEFKSGKVETIQMLGDNHSMMMFTKQEYIKKETKFVRIRLESLKDRKNTSEMASSHVAGKMNVRNIFTHPALIILFGNYRPILMRFRY